jgi:hypothetical protein
MPYNPHEIIKFDIFDYNETLKDKSLGTFSFSLGFLFYELKLDFKTNRFEEADRIGKYANLSEKLKNDGFKAKFKNGSDGTIEMYI